MRLYYHKTDGGAEYLFDTFTKCQGGHKEGTINDKTRFVVRIDGDIRKDAELTISDPQIASAPALLAACRGLLPLALAYYRTLPDDGPAQDHYMTSVIGPAQDAIAKAEGGAP
jgi:hypothetical protein